MKTTRTSKLGKLDFRLVEKDKRYFGVVVGDGARKAQIEGDDADEVWRRLLDRNGGAEPLIRSFRLFALAGRKGEASVIVEFVLIELVEFSQSNTRFHQFFEVVHHVLVGILVVRRHRIS